MKSFRFAFACTLIGLLATMAAWAEPRPLVLHESALVRPPDASWETFGRFGVAIDGDWALISGERNDPTRDGETDDGNWTDGAIFIYRRSSGGAWNYVGLLHPLYDVYEWMKPGLAMRNGIAVSTQGGPQIFERVGETWVRATVAPGALSGLQGGDIEIDGDRILIPMIACSHNSAVLRKVNGTWVREGTLLGHSNDCGDSPPTPMQSLHGTRAALFNEEGLNFEAPRIRLYSATNNVWSEVAGIEGFTRVAGEVALNGPYVATNGTRERGTSIYHWPLGGVPTLTKYGLQPADAYMRGYTNSATPIERVGPFFAQRTFSQDMNGGHVIQLWRINDDAVHSNTHVATLVQKHEAWLGDEIDSDGRRVIVNGREGWQGHNIVRIYDLPTDYSTPAVQNHDFESPSSAAAWQVSAGGTYSLATRGYSRVFLQPSTSGTPAAWLTNSDMTNQSIQAEVTYVTGSGTNAWVGLATRRADDRNYYYVTLRASGTVELKRMVDGAFQTLSSAPFGVVAGTKYRLRLESIGNQHRVYINDQVRAFAVDDSLTRGIAGLLTNRASAEFDNVVVSPHWFTTIYRNGFEPLDQPKIWHQRGGTWQLTGGIMRQASNVDYARVFTGARTGDQIVQVRIKPLSFAGTDYWVGLLARWQDERNHLYFSMHQRGVISLWRRTNGAITQLATRRFPVTVGQWYAVRVEIINGQTRVLVNDQLQLSTSADPGPVMTDGTEQKGHVGLITYRATADYDDFLAYQP
jgi:hypothetical protein